MEVSKRWEYAKKLKLCFRCLGEGHTGQSCFHTRICGLDGCQEVHHRLLHKQAVNKNSTVNKNSSDSRKKKNVDDNQSVNSSKTTGLSSEGETADKNEDATQQNNHGHTE